MDIFVSYARKDQETARELSRLLSKAGATVWLDAERLVPGTFWDEAIKKGLEDSSSFVVLFGDSRIEKTQRAELTSAMERSLRDPRFRIIPVLLPHAAVDDIPPTLRGFPAIDLRDAPNEAARARRLLASIITDPKTGETADNESIGDRLKETGDFSGARPYYEKALAIAVATFGDSHPNVARIHLKLGATFFEQGDLSIAERHFSLALTSDEMTFGSDHPRVAADLNNLGLVYSARGEHERSKATLERSLEINRRVHGESSPEFATALNNLASTVHASGDLTNARMYLEEALAITRAANGPKHPDVATRLNNIAGVLYDARDFLEARAYAEEALKITMEVYGDDHPKVSPRLHNLGAIYRELNDLPRAREYFERALAIARRSQARRDEALALNSLGHIHRAMGDLTEARRLYEESLALTTAIFGSDNQLARDVRANVAATESQESKGP